MSNAKRKCRWILEEDVFEEGLGRLTSALDQNGNDYQFVKYYQVVEALENHCYNDPFEFYPDENPIAFYGSLNLAKYLQHKTNFVPGPICNLDNFRYTTYAPHFGNLMLNEDWVSLPLREAIRQRNMLFHMFGDSSKHIFVRPVAGDKPFAGKAISYDKFNLDGFYYGFYFEDKDLPIIISSAKNVGREIRYFVKDKTILSSSEYGQYKKSTKYGHKNPDEFVEKVLKTVDWSPDTMYTLDIIEDEEDWRVAEINSASCSGMYDCDPLPIVKTMSEIAEHQWSETWNF